MAFLVLPGFHSPLSFSQEAVIVREVQRACQTGEEAVYLVNQVRATLLTRICLVFWSLFVSRDILRKRGLSFPSEVEVKDLVTCLAALGRARNSMDRVQGSLSPIQKMSLDITSGFLLLRVGRLRVMKTDGTQGGIIALSPDL